MHVWLTPVDFVTDTDFEGWEARMCGAYWCLLLALYLNEGKLPNDQSVLQKKAHWHGSGWKEAWGCLRSKFKLTRFYIRHKRVTEELLKAAEAIEKKRKGGIARAKQLWGEDSVADSDATSCAIGKEKRREEKGTEEKRKKQKGVEIPDSLDTPEFQEIWELWIQHRIEIRKPATPTAQKLQLRRLAKYGVARAVEYVEYSIAQGWQGVFPPKANEVPVPSDSAHADLFANWPEDGMPKYTQTQIDKLVGDIGIGEIQKITADQIRQAWSKYCGRPKADRIPWSPWYVRLVIQDSAERATGSGRRPSGPGRLRRELQEIVDGGGKLSPEYQKQYDAMQGGKESKR